MNRTRNSHVPQVSVVGEGLRHSHPRTEPKERMNIHSFFIERREVSIERHCSKKGNAHYWNRTSDLIMSSAASCPEKGTILLLVMRFTTKPSGLVNLIARKVRILTFTTQYIPQISAGISLSYPKLGCHCNKFILISTFLVVYLYTYLYYKPPPSPHFKETMVTVINAPVV